MDAYASRMVLKTGINTKASIANNAYSIYHKVTKMNTTNNGTKTYWFNIW